MATLESIMNKLAGMAGQDRNGESRASQAVASQAARLYGALAVEADPTLAAAADMAAVAKARRSLYVARQTIEEKAELALNSRLAAARALHDATPEQVSMLQSAATLLRPPKASKAPESMVSDSDQATSTGASAGLSTPATQS